MGVITTKEQILKDQGPSFKLPWRPNPLDTAGRTNTIVDDPVIANTVQISAISRYHAADQRSGMGLGSRYDFQNWENDDDGGFEIDSFVPDLTASFIDLDSPFIDFTPPVDAKRRAVDLFIDSTKYIIFGDVGQRV